MIFRISRGPWFIATIILAAGLAWIIFSAVPASAVTAGQVPAPKEGFLAPDFSLQSLDGKQVSLSSYKGQPVIINLWASWCPPCKAEMPALQKVYETYQGQGLVILAVNATNQDTEAAARSFAEKEGLAFPVLLDPDGAVSRKYLLQALPSSFFVGKDGIIRKVVIGGPMPEALLRSQIQDLMEGP